MNKESSYSFFESEARAKENQIWVMEDTYIPVTSSAQVDMYIKALHSCHENLRIVIMIEKFTVDIHNLMNDNYDVTVYDGHVSMKKFYNVSIFTLISNAEIMIKNNLSEFNINTCVFATYANDTDNAVYEIPIYIYMYDRTRFRLLYTIADGIIDCIELLDNDGDPIECILNGNNHFEYFTLCSPYNNIYISVSHYDKDIYQAADTKYLSMRLIDNVRKIESIEDIENLLPAGDLCIDDKTMLNLFTDFARGKIKQLQIGQVLFESVSLSIIDRARYRKCNMFIYNSDIQHKIVIEFSPSGIINSITNRRPKAYNYKTGDVIAHVKSYDGTNITYFYAGKNLDVLSIWKHGGLYFIDYMQVNIMRVIEDELNSTNKCVKCEFRDIYGYTIDLIATQRIDERTRLDYIDISDLKITKNKIKENESNEEAK